MGNLAAPTHPKIYQKAGQKSIGRLSSDLPRNAMNANDLDNVAVGHTLHGNLITRKPAEPSHSARA